MNKLVGRYARTVNGSMYLIEEGNIGYAIDFNYKVANDPRELIEVGDLVKDKTKRGSVLEINRIDINSLGARLLYSFGTPILFGNITEIWTKTSENTFTRQWSDDE